MRAHLEAYGCAMNIGEAREAEAALLRQGYELVRSPEGAKFQVLVSCVVIEATERHMLKRLRALEDAGGRLILSGCMASTPSRARALDVAPRAELVPPGELPAFLDPSLHACDPAFVPPAERSPAAIIPIAQGCLGSCSYCITKIARGSVRSYPIPWLVRKVEAAVHDGPREVQLTGQDTAAYGAEDGGSLPALLEAIGGIEGEFRVRVGMMNRSMKLTHLSLAGWRRSLPASPTRLAAPRRAPWRPSLHRRLGSPWNSRRPEPETVLQRY